MIPGLLLQIFSGILGLGLAIRFVSGVEFTGSLQTLFWAGVILGLINFFIKPVVKLITWPLRILTFGLFTIVINMALVWTVDILFPELIIEGVISLFWTTVIVWTLSILLSILGKGKI